MHAQTKREGMNALRLLLLKQEMRPGELAQSLDVDLATVHRWIGEMPAIRKVSYGVYKYIPTDDEIELARLILAAATNT